MLCLLFRGVSSVDHHVSTHFSQVLTGATHIVCKESKEMDDRSVIEFQKIRTSSSETLLVETPTDPTIFYQFYGPN